VIARAGELVGEHTLRAYDAIHLATALALREEASELLAQREPAQESQEEGDELVVFLMSYDSSLIEAAHKEGLAYEPEHPGKETN
jgi:hypothetical protein